MSWQDFHEDYELPGEADEFARDVTWVREAVCAKRTPDDPVGVREFPSKWPAIDEILETFYGLDGRMAHQLDKRHQMLTGRDETFFAYLQKVLEEPIPVDGLAKDEEACLSFIGNLCDRWGIDIESGRNTCFFNFMQIFMEGLEYNWDMYKLPERIQKLYTPPS
ncbi:hypothetical protein [Pseudohalioglobus lutimaris]|uniref:Uncharacterized protein n=1 Tax=Pseudohalioglobus lutimaris TaxID=1737061 RepID=A0A2N5X4N3_9GAMM|nr:hypothetical protein [Pseudohalioglobus lutimaris]PLW69445.1 hypothetical protein C0039_07925 [Pseudohalioglobus lutimaris]